MECGAYYFPISYAASFTSLFLLKRLNHTTIPYKIIYLMHQSAALQDELVQVYS